MDTQRKAFVIMPFDVEFDSIYESLIKPSLEDAGYEVTRADSLFDQRNILKEIILGITSAHLIVADLTANNPNVFYELGLCHGLRVPTVLIAQSINDIPFDLRSYKIHIYETHFNKIKKLRDFLKEIGKKHLKSEISFGSPVVDFSPDKNSPAESGGQIPITEGKKKPSDEVEDRGFLDYLVDGETATNELTGILTRLLKDNEVLTARITRHTATMQALSRNSTAGSAGKFHKISLLVSADMNSFSKKVEDIIPFFEDTIERLAQNYLGYLNIVEADTEVDRQRLRRLRESIEALGENSVEANKGLHLFRESTLGLGEQKISKDLTRASRRQADALNGLISTLQRLEAFSTKTLAMVDDKFGEELQLM